VARFACSKSHSGQMPRSIVYKERSEVDRAPFRASILTHYGNPI
jgi:hypothetical protein